MMTAARQLINAVYMYFYLLYYTERVRRDRKFMIKEAIKEINKQHDKTLKKLAEYERENRWRF